jgi:hypothetical protein
MKRATSANGKTLTIKEAAALWGVSVQAVYQWREAGRVRMFSPDGEGGYLPALETEVRAAGLVQRNTVLQRLTLDNDESGRRELARLSAICGVSPNEESRYSLDDVDRLLRGQLGPEAEEGDCDGLLERYRRERQWPRSLPASFWRCARAKVFHAPVGVFKYKVGEPFNGEWGLPHVSFTRSEGYEETDDSAGYRLAAGTTTVVLLIDANPMRGEMALRNAEYARAKREWFGMLRRYGTAARPKSGRGRWQGESRLVESELNRQSARHALSEKRPSSRQVKT